MSRAQPSILSFFQPRQPPNYAAPPSQQRQQQQQQQQLTRAAQNGLDTTGPAQQASPAASRPALVAIAPAPPPLTATAPNPAPQTLPPQASIAPVEERHIPALRRINSLLLAVNYPDSFYHRVLDPALCGPFSRIILWRDDDDNPAADPKVIGGIVCCLEPSPFAPSAQQPLPSPTPSSLGPVGATPSHAVYIRSLALLAPYRTHGLAAAALEDVLAAAAALTASPASHLAIHTVYAHVWTENADGLRWYASRGFARDGPAPVAGYYFKLRPDSAWVVRRALAPAPQQPPAASRWEAAVAAAGGGREPARARVVAEAVDLPPLARSESGLSYQNSRPETEWNDLPADMVAGASGRSSRSDLLSPPPPPTGSGPGSGASSRSSSTARKKRDRAYPAAAFGS